MSRYPASLAPGLSILAIVAAAGSLTSVARAQSWAAPSSGLWFTAANWSPASVPTGVSAVGTLGLSGVYSVTTTSNTLLGLNITNSQASLGIVQGNALMLVGSAPGVVNTLNGQIIVNNSGSYTGTYLTIGAPAVTFSGTGSLRLNASPSDPSTTANTALINGTGGGTIVMGSGTTLGGFGQMSGVPSTNNGTFTADIAGRVLLINGGTHQNNALYTAANGGALVLQNDTVTQGASGQIAPGAGSSVQLANSSVTGGSVVSNPTGRVQVNGSTTATLSGVTVSGGLDTYPGSITYISAGGITLVGGATLTVNTPSAYSGTHLMTGIADTPINGNGTVRLAASPSDPSTTALTAEIREDGGTADGSFVFAPGVTLAGFGMVNNIPTTNNGVFNADIPGRLLRVEANVHQNNNLYTATGGGVLQLSNAGVTQAPGASITAVGAAPDTTPSNVQLVNSSVAYGTLSSNGAARVQVNTGTSATLTAVAINGGLDVYHGAIVHVNSPGVTLNGGATLLVNAPGSYSGTSLRTADADTAFAGSGTVRLNASLSDPTATNLTAALSVDGATPGAYTFAPGVTLAGFGIVNGIPTTNNGVFNADINGRPLRVQGATHQNNNLYQSSNGGTLWVVGATVNQGAGARTLAGDDSAVVFSSSRINGGTVGSPAGGTGVTSVDATAVQLEGVNVSRQLTVNTGGTLVSAAGVTLTNNAQVTINTAGSYAGTRFRADGAPTSVSGIGAVHLNASTSDGTAASLTAALTRNGAVTGSGFAFAQDITVDGFGIVSDCPTVNNGTFNANSGGHPLRFEGNSHQNNGNFRSSGGGTLVLSNCAVAQGSAGVITAGDASGVTLSGATVTGGAITAAGSGRTTVGGSSHIGSLTNSSPMDVNNSQTLTVDGPGITNNNVITVNTAGAYAGTSVRAGAAGTAIGGTGEVRLNRSGSDGSATAGTADLGASSAGDSFVFGSGQTLSGSGRVTSPVTMNGTVSPGIGTGAVDFIRNEAGATLGFTSSGRLHIDVQSSSAYDRLVNAGTVNLAGTLVMDSAYNATPGTIFDVITGGTINGQFGSVVSNGLSSPKRFGVRYDVAGKVRVTVLCGAADIGSVGADGNGDGFLDNNDFIVFIDRFFNSDPRADFGSVGGVPGPDGQFDNNDFIVFIDVFFAGCF